MMENVNEMNDGRAKVDEKRESNEMDDGVK